MNWLLEPLQYEFIVRAMLAALLVGVVCSIPVSYTHLDVYKRQA